MANPISMIEGKKSFGNRITKGAVIVIALYIAVFVIAYFGLSLFEGALEFVAARYLGFDHLFARYDYHLDKAFTALAAGIVGVFGSHAIANSLSAFVPGGSSVGNFVAKSLRRNLYQFGISAACSIFVISFNLWAYQIETPMPHDFVSQRNAQPNVTACVWPSGWVDYGRLHRVSDRLGNPCHPITKEDIQKILLQEEAAQQASNLRAQQEQEQRRQQQIKADADRSAQESKEAAEQIEHRKWLSSLVGSSDGAETRRSAQVEPQRQAPEDDSNKEEAHTPKDVLEHSTQEEQNSSASPTKRGMGYGPPDSGMDAQTSGAGREQAPASQQQATDDAYAKGLDEQAQEAAALKQRQQTVLRWPAVTQNGAFILPVGWAWPSGALINVDVLVGLDGKVRKVVLQQNVHQLLVDSVSSAAWHTTFSPAICGTGLACEQWARLQYEIKPGTASPAIVISNRSSHTMHSSFNVQLHLR